MDWTWTIINLDPYVNYILRELGRWVADNATFLLIITFVLAKLQQQAERLEAVKDNRKLSLLGYYIFWITRALLYIFSFTWLTQFRTVKAKEIPVIVNQPLQGVAETECDKIQEEKSETEESK